MRVLFGGLCLPFLLLAVCGCGSSPLFTASDDPGTILDRAIQAQGGERYQERWKTGTARYRRTTADGEYLVREHFDLPRYFRQTERQVRPEGDVKTVVVNDEQCWVKSADGVRKLDDAPANPSLYYWASIVNLAEYRAADVRLSVKGQVKEDDRTLVILHVDSEKFGSPDLYFDAKTGLLTKSVKVIPLDSELPIAGAGTMELSDYRDLGGVKFPFRILFKSNNQRRAEIVFEEVKLLDEIDHSLFAEPK
jgi:hypothetical protein